MFHFLQNEAYTDGLKKKKKKTLKVNLQPRKKDIRGNHQERGVN